MSERGVKRRRNEEGGRRNTTRTTLNLMAALNSNINLPPPPTSPGLSQRQLSDEGKKLVRRALSDENEDESDETMLSAPSLDYDTLARSLMKGYPSTPHLPFSPGVQSDDSIGDIASLLLPLLTQHLEAIYPMI